MSAAVLAKFGPAPPKAGADRYDEPVAWTQRVLREYVLPELAPDVVINWLTEPDHSQHRSAWARRPRARRSATTTPRSRACWPPWTRSG